MQVHSPCAGDRGGNGKELASGSAVGAPATKLLIPLVCAAVPHGLQHRPPHGILVHIIGLALRAKTKNQPR
jgi:hypothetical protein